MQLTTFIPKILKWTLPSLNLDTSTVANGGLSQKMNNSMANSVDTDQKARYELSHLNLHCLKRLQG